RTADRAHGARILQGRASIQEVLMVPSPLFGGIDVAKATLDIAVRPTAETWSVSNDATGIDALVLRLGALAPPLIDLESTGGYERPRDAALLASCSRVGLL